MLHVLHNRAPAVIKMVSFLLRQVLWLDKSEGPHRCTVVATSIALCRHIIRQAAEPSDPRIFQTWRRELKVFRHCKFLLLPLNLLPFGMFVNIPIGAV